MPDGIAVEELWHVERHFIAGGDITEAAKIFNCSYLLYKCDYGIIMSKVSVKWH